MRIVVSDEAVEVRLSWWQKALGLMRNVRVGRADVGDVRVVQDPVRQAMRTGIKVGLRLPWLYYAARTIQLDHMFVVRRGVPALSFSVSGPGRLRAVLVSCPEAERLAQQLRRA